MAKKRRRKGSSKKRASTKRKAKGHVPLPILKRRLAKLTKIVKQRDK